MKESRSSRQKRRRGKVRSGTTTTVGGGSQHRQSAVVVCTVVSIGVQHRSWSIFDDFGDFWRFFTIFKLRWWRLTFRSGQHWKLLIYLEAVGNAARGEIYKHNVVQTDF